MLSRDRLQRATEMGARVASERRMRIVAQLLLAAGLVFVAFRIRSILHDSRFSLDHVGWGWLAGSLVLAVCAVVASAFTWLEILRLLGSTPRPSWAAAYLQGQLGKYVPGSVWQYAGRGALARRRGVPVGSFARSLPIELTAVFLAACAFAMLLLGWWGAIGTVTLVGVARVGASARRLPAWLRGAARMSTLYAAMWMLVAPSFWMTARALIGTRSGDLAFYAGAFAAAWIVGFVAIYTPGGIGVREALLVAILRSRIGTADAVLVAAASRLVLTTADVMAAGLSFLVSGGPGGLGRRQGRSLQTYDEVS